jgi:DNA/RNA endonuclease YhcR with UshA esterase domain
MRKTIATALLICCSVAVLVRAQSSRLTTTEAKNHIGEKATVCGTVVSTHYAVRTKGSPTFLNLDEPFPKQVFTILVWGSDRAKFGDPESKFDNKRVCVTGLIKDYKGVPEIIAEQPNQIEFQK